jgi:hypothetical protein
MKRADLLCMFVLISVASFAQTTARDYFNELYKVGGLDRMAAQYVCFRDDKDAQVFFIFAESSNVRDFLKEQGTFAKLPKEAQQALNKGYLMVRGYDRGVPWKEPSTLGKDGDSWISGTKHLGEAKSPASGSLRVRLTINWQTLRYKWAVEYGHQALDQEKTSYGRCEHIPLDVLQHG